MTHRFLSVGFLEQSSAIYYLYLLSRVYVKKCGEIDFCAHIDNELSQSLSAREMFAHTQKIFVKLFGISIA